MKKFIISFVIYTTLFSIVFNHLNKVFATQNHFVNTTEDFKKLAKKTEIDIVFYGSSHAYTAYNPYVINEKCKVLSYNLGSDGLRLSLTDLVLKESLKYTKPKLIVLEVYRGSLTLPSTDKSKGYQLRALDFVSNFNYDKYSEISEIYKAEEYLGVLFPQIRNHGKWLITNYFSYDKREEIDSDKGFYYSGFLGYNNIINKGRSKYKNFKTHKIKRDGSIKLLSDRSKQDLFNFIEVANQNDIKVLIVSSPDLRTNYNNYNFFDELSVYCDHLNVPFLNLNEFYKELKLDLDDFKDPGHLNIVGSIKTSKFLAKYINANYSFKDRSDEQTWKNEIESLKENSFLIRHLKLANSRSKINKIELFNLILKKGNYFSKKHKFTNDLTVEHSILYSNDKNDFLLLKCDKNLKKQNLKNLAFGIHKVVYEKDFDKRPPRFKKKNSSFISDKSYIEYVDFNGKQYILLTFQKQTNIKEFKAVKLFFVNKEKFNGIIGEKFIIKGMKF